MLSQLQWWSSPSTQWLHRLQCLVLVQTGISHNSHKSGVRGLSHLKLVMTAAYSITSHLSLLFRTRLSGLLSDLRTRTMLVSYKPKDIKKQVKPSALFIRTLDKFETYFQGRVRLVHEEEKKENKDLREEVGSGENLGGGSEGFGHGLFRLCRRLFDLAAHRVSFQICVQGERRCLSADCC